MKKKDLVNNFDKYLWNRYDPLHERLLKKIAYLSKVLSNFTDIYHIKREYYKNVKPYIKEDIPVCKEEENFQNVLGLVKSTSEKYNEYEEEMYAEIIANIRDLIEKMKKEKNYYDDYLKTLAFYKDEKKKMEKFRSVYHSNAQVAEKSTIYFKELVIKKKLNNDALINQQIDICENDAKNRLAVMAKDCAIYVSSLDAVNNLRQKLNLKQRKLLKRYESLEKEDKELYSKIMEIIRKYQKKILDYTGGQMNITQGIQKNLNIDNEIRNLVESLRSREKPEEEIPYEHYPTEIDFDKCADNKDFKVTNEVVKMMKKFTDKIFINYDEKLEENKNKMRDLINKFFDLNKCTDEDDKNQLMEYLKDQRTHELFLIILSKLRTNNRFCREKPLIEILADIIQMILDNAQKKNDYATAKNCIILSQTFYYIDDSKNAKVYILELIKKHPWLKSMKFWNDFMLIMILKEFKKLEEMNTEEPISIVRNINISDKIKPKIGEVLFSQILPYVGNMSEFGIEKKQIVKMIDDINQRFNYLGKDNLDSIYNLVCSSKEELEKVREEIKNDQSLKGSSLNEAIIKNSIRNDPFYDEDVDE